MNAPAFQRRGPSPFAKRQAEISKKAEYVVELPASLWADGRPNKPKEPVKIGLRLVSEAEHDRARTIAAKHAWANHQDPKDEELRIESYNGRLMALLMSEAAVLPENNETKFFGTVADTKIALDLTPDGIRYLWDHYETFAVSHSAVAPEASDDEMLELADAITTGGIFSGLDIEQSRRLRRLLKAAAEIMNGTF